MARNTLNKVVTLPNGKKAYYFQSVVSTAGNANGSLTSLPAGEYNIYFYGTHTNAADDATFSVEGFTDEAQSTVFDIGGGLYDDTTAVDAVVLDAAKTSFSGWFGTSGGLGMVANGVFLPYGAKWTYVVGSASAVDISVIFVEK